MYRTYVRVYRTGTIHATKMRVYKEIHDTEGGLIAILLA